jgi:hypothetical protein
MNALLTRVLTDYGLLVAGWSVQYDHALRDAVTAQYPSIFTMGWVAPGRLSTAASTLVTNKKALVLPTTADDPLSLSVAVSRIKRDLSQQRPAIAAHDMLAAELTQLRGQPAFDLARSMNGDETQYRSYLSQIYEASRIPAASVATLAYWGDDSTDAWWMPDVQRLATLPLLSGTVGFIELPLIAGSILFYAAGVASVAGQRFALLPKLFSLRGNRSGNLPQPLNEVLAAPTLLPGELAVAHYEEIMGAAGEALGIGMEPIDDALQTFDVLRLCAQIINNENFKASVDGYALTTPPR